MHIFPDISLKSIQNIHSKNKCVLNFLTHKLEIENDFLSSQSHVMWDYSLTRQKSKKPKQVKTIFGSRYSNNLIQIERNGIDGLGKKGDNNSYASNSLWWKNSNKQ